MIWPVATDKYLGFLAVMAAMAIMPGPAILFAVAAGMARGPRGAVLATVGMNLAALVWFVGSALGLVVLASTVPWVFRLAGWIGVLYIGWLGLEALFAAFRREPAAPKAMKTPGVSVFRDGFLVQATNPKALLFFTAVLPPFVDLGRPVWPQMAAFALGLFILDGTAMISYGMLGAAFAHKMGEPKFRRAFSLLVGSILLFVAGLMLLRL
ncbi:LysE family translocator [Telmatospirillum siberiense]|uniref:LysE family translocator n=1 Tax=Telmatospirillum siberiense TaxID=382514 RepID=A0A2N3PUX0_9PROT|nr:LysE family translocator [Telmatospirillum siberiense]PKU24190.1 LysE family translocator [Telmatospirillum siberiense]